MDVSNHGCRGGCLDLYPRSLIGRFDFIRQEQKCWCSIWDFIVEYISNVAWYILNQQALNRDHQI